ncbi:hypothetical protein EFW17_03985 [Halostreptopolyspora alba]|uniref:Uncharacterized protein n=1 Tax=Halostreptopolyspora alba TaxID=2487137 RepID=A0A3N0EET3_9ACTN|nr:hypothetical protein EFW17_03985 [Nocardiopsaceae bacterium YIM 96095]
MSVPALDVGTTGVTALVAAEEGRGHSRFFEGQLPHAALIGWSGWSAPSVSEGRTTSSTREGVAILGRRTWAGEEGPAGAV